MLYDGDVGRVRGADDEPTTLLAAWAHDAHKQ